MGVISIFFQESRVYIKKVSLPLGIENRPGEMKTLQYMKDALAGPKNTVIGNLEGNSLMQINYQNMIDDWKMQK